MANNAQKTPVAGSLNRFAERKILEAIEVLGKALPASVTSVTGSIVDVKFELTTTFTLPEVTVPLFGPEYIRYPIQVGCKGVVFPVDAYTGAVDGLGGGPADLTPPMNLSALVFFPVGNKGWTVVDGKYLVLYGAEEGGVKIMDITDATSITLNADGITMKNNVTIQGDLTVTGDVSLGGGAKKVVLDGDPVSGGAVHATSTKVTAT